MTPKEKAEELVSRFLLHVPAICSVHNAKNSVNNAKKCALIAVDEIIDTGMLINEDTYVMKPSYLQYWLEVKKEIEKL
jgi:hypothetical protein